MLDRIGNVLKHIILLLDDRGGERAQGAGDAEGSVVHREDIDGELVKAFMTTDASVPDVPIVETSPGFQVACRHSTWLRLESQCIQHHACCGSVQLQMCHCQVFVSQRSLLQQVAAAGALSF